MKKIFQRRLKKGAARMKGMFEEDALALWQERLRLGREAYWDQLCLMDEREALNKGSRSIDRGGDSPGGVKKASAVRNVVAEIVESQVDNHVPSPKVTAQCEENRELAQTVEDMLRKELARLPFADMNDLDERTTLIQGGDIFLVEWDNGTRTHSTVGDLSVTLLHPKQVIPQPGVSELRDMDYVIVQLSRTKAAIRERYGVDVGNEREESPSTRGGAVPMDELVTQNMAFYRGEMGAIGLFSWVNDVVLADDGAYQKRKIPVCEKCGTGMTDGVCTACGCTKAVWHAAGTEILARDVTLRDGRTIAAGTVLPLYDPGEFPLVIRKNVSSYAAFLGDSDVDKIRDQQNEIKKVYTRIGEKIGKGGSIVTLPKGLVMRRTDEELKVVELSSPADKALIDVISIQADIGRDLQYIARNYEDARNVAGITDSYLGRQDATANSGKAKEIAVAQTAGRLESKRTMKKSAYARLFSLMFRFLLAYCDEPRCVGHVTTDGRMEYRPFSRYDFLRQDAAGQWYYDDDFLFEVDAAAALTGNRQAMWEENRNLLQMGAFGAPSTLPALILFWTKMEQLSYPGAAGVLSYLTRQAERDARAEDGAPPSAVSLEEVRKELSKIGV